MLAWTDAASCRGDSSRPSPMQRAASSAEWKRAPWPIGSGSVHVTERDPSADVTTTSPGMKNGPGRVSVAAVPAMVADVGVRVSSVECSTLVASPAWVSTIAAWPLTPVAVISPAAWTRGGRTERPRRERRDVGAEVEERPARHGRVEDAVRRVEVLAVVGEDGAHVPEQAGVEHLPHDVEARQEEGPHRLHAEDAGGRGGSRDLLCLSGIEADRLLDEHVLAGLDGEQRALAVQVVRRRDVDDVDVRVGEQRVAGLNALSIAAVAANASAEACVRDPTATTRWVVEACSDATKREAIHPVPSTPQRRLGTDDG